MTHGSLFAGIEGFGLGFERAGFELKWQVECNKFCRRVLRKQWPEVKRFADVRRAGAHNLKPVDCITAGVPCQDVSVAGRRAGLAGSRTGLFYEFARILCELRPAWFVFENVPGLLSSNAGRDFAEVLRVLMVECRYGVSWRVLNSRYFGVAQRRRRVFIVGRFGKPCPVEVLFDSASSDRDFAPRRQEGASVAAPLTHGSGVTGNSPRRRHGDDENIVSSCLDGSPYADREAEESRLVASTLLSGENRTGGTRPPGSTVDNADSLVIAAPIIASRGHHGHSSERGDGQDNLVAATLPACRRLQTDGNRDNLQVSYALRNDPGGIGQGHNTTYAITENMRNRSQGPANYVASTLDHSDGGQRIEREYVSTPLDPDGMRDFAGLPEGLDSARYRALGNAVTVQVGEWIGRRILEAERS